MFSSVGKLRSAARTYSMREPTKPSNKIAWLTLFLTGCTLLVTGFNAFEDSLAKKETNGVSRAAAVKDLVPKLMGTVSSRRERMLSFDLVISSLSTESSGMLKAKDVRRDAGSLDQFLILLWHTELDPAVNCYYGRRLVDIHVIIQNDPNCGPSDDSYGGTVQTPINGVPIVPTPAGSAPTSTTPASGSAPSDPASASSAGTPASGVSPAASAALALEMRTLRSGPQPSGSGKEFSQPYTLCADVSSNPGETIDSSQFLLIGDRSCSAWSKCENVGTTATKACWKFSMQGHDERPFSSIGFSEGILRYWVRSKQ